MNTEYAEALGHVLATHRKLAGLNKQQLSLMTNISRLTLRRIENGTDNPTTNTLMRITSALDVSLADVFVECEQALRSQHNETPEGLFQNPSETKVCYRLTKF